jgi:hypothetical protein
MQPNQSGPLRVLFMSVLLSHLSGCAYDPVNLMLSGMNTTDKAMEQEIVADYEKAYIQANPLFNCQALKKEREMLQNKDGTNPFYGHPTAVLYDQAIGNIQVRKGCANTSSISNVTGQSETSIAQ